MKIIGEARGADYVRSGMGESPSAGMATPLEFFLLLTALFAGLTGLGGHRVDAGARGEQVAMVSAPRAAVQAAAWAVRAVRPALAFAVRPDARRVATKLALPRVMRLPALPRPVPERRRE